MSEQRIGIGRVMRDRRMALGHTQTSLSRAMGDSISATWISRYESEDGEPQRLTIVRLADVLRLPKDDLLNAFGLATDAQRTDAIARLEGLVDVPSEPRGVPVVGPDGRHTGREVEGYAPPSDEVVAVELDDSHPIYRGTVIVSTSRRPRAGDAIVATVDGRLVAGTLRRVGNRRVWLERPEGDITDMAPLGVIAAHP